MTLDQFAPIFALLATQLRASDADESTIRAYFAALQDLEIELVADAATRLAQQAAPDAWFPKTPEWRFVVEQVWAERVQQQRAILRNAPAPLCAVCDDTGWARSTAIEKGRPVARVRRCACAGDRYAELLGRKPMPRLGPMPNPDPTQEARALAMIRQAVKA